MNLYKVIGTLILLTYNKLHSLKIIIRTTAEIERHKTAQIITVDSTAISANSFSEIRAQMRVKHRSHHYWYKITKRRPRACTNYNSTINLVVKEFSQSTRFTAKTSFGADHYSHSSLPLMTLGQNSSHRKR